METIHVYRGMGYMGNLCTLFLIFTCLFLTALVFVAARGLSLVAASGCYSPSVASLVVEQGL